MEDASAPQPPAPSPADLEKAKRLMSSMRNSKGTRPVTNSRQSLEGVEKPTASIRAIPQDPQRELVPGAKTHNPAELQQAASLSRSINRITEDPRKQVQIAQALMMEAKRIRNQTAGVVGLVFLAGALGFGGYMLYHRWNAAVAAAAAAAASNAKKIIMTETTSAAAATTATHVVAEPTPTPATTPVSSPAPTTPATQPVEEKEEESFFQKVEEEAEKIVAHLKGGKAKKDKSAATSKKEEKSSADKKSSKKAGTKDEKKSSEATRKSERLKNKVTKQHFKRVKLTPTKKKAAKD